MKKTDEEKNNMPDLKSVTKGHLDERYYSWVTYK